MFEADYSFYISTGELELLMHYLTSESFALILYYTVIQYVASCFLCNDCVFESAES